MLGLRDFLLYISLSAAQPPVGAVGLSGSGRSGSHGPIVPMPRITPAVVPWDVGMYSPSVRMAS